MKPEHLFSLSAVLYVGGFVVLFATNTRAQMPSLEELIKVRPLPAEQLKAFYNTNALPDLTRFADDPKMLRYGANVMLAIGVLGGDQGTMFLIDYLERHFQGEVGDDQSRALIFVPQALGNQASRGSLKAREYLVSRHTVNSWRGAGIRWWHRSAQGEVLYKLLANRVLIALLVVDHPEVHKLYSRLAFDNSADYVETRRLIPDAQKMISVYEAGAQRRIRPPQGVNDSQTSAIRAQPPAPENYARPPLTEAEAVGGTTAKMTRLSESEARGLLGEALKEFDRIAQLFLDQPLEKSSAFLADNGRPLLGAKQSPAQTEWLIGELTENGSLDKARTLLREVRTAGKRYGSASAFKQADGSIVLIVPLDGTADLKRKHIQSNDPTLTATRGNELAVVMVKVGERWYWQPFAW